MSLNNLNQFPVAETMYINLNSFQLIVLVVGLIQFLLFQILHERKRISNFFLGFQSPIKSHFNRAAADCSRDQIPTKNTDFESSVEKEKKKSEDKSLCNGDLEVVLRSLGMISSEGTGIHPSGLNSEDVVNLFEEKNPSLDEVKEAFDVFDKNRDGFIDEYELQRVLCNLGMKEGLEMENCRRMIGVFDENGDGRIDFEEFVKFMEASLC